MKALALRFFGMMLMMTLLGVVVGGCGSSIASRIQAQQAVFDAYPKEMQERLTRGQVRLGDDQDAVWIAFGSPMEKQYRIDDTGRVDIWIYKYLTHNPALLQTVRPVYYDVGGRMRGDYYIDDTHEYVWKESLRVEFKNGKVSAIQGSD